MGIVSARFRRFTDMGFGPGSGKAVSLRYTSLGKPWHSLYLQVGVELGLIGLGALAWLAGHAALARVAAFGGFPAKLCRWWAWWLSCWSGYR